MSEALKGAIVARPRLLGLAWRNTLRNARRTALTGSAVVVAAGAVIFMLAYMRGIIANVEDTYARTESGHARITREGYLDRQRFMPLYLNVSGLTELLPSLRGHPAVIEALPRIRAAVLANTDEMNVGALVLGIDLEREEGYLDPQRMLAGGRLPVPGRAEALLGVGLASKLGLVPGDSLTILGQTAWRSFGGLRVEVAGIGQAGVPYLDGSLILLPLDQAQLLADLPNAATDVLVFSGDKAQRDRLASLLAADRPIPEGLEVTSWREEGALLSLMRVAQAAWGLFLLILMGMAGLIIVNTMLMAVLERTRELGMLAAMGLRRGSVIRLVMTEGLIIGLLGSAVGAALGTGIALWVGAVGIDISAAMEGTEFPMDSVIYPDWHWTQVAVAAGLGVATGILAAFYPALRAVKLAPAEALRR
jgi:putative ABC transport system permease protein